MIPRLILLIVLLTILIAQLAWKLESFTEPCADKLTDREYLEHMIPHHQVAVDISKMLQKISKWPKMQEILRELIWVQEYEIAMMNQMLDTLPADTNWEAMNRTYLDMVSNSIPPNKIDLTQTYCDPHFFDPEAHMKHLSHMKLDDKMYLEHMIPHHQVAVDMSKKLLRHTKNDFMIHLAYRIIRSQQDEIILLTNLLDDKNYQYQSEMLR